MKLNWKVRFKNPVWWVTAGIPQMIIIAQLVLTFINNFIYPTGYVITEDGVEGFMAIVNAVALLLGIGGAVIDPTTKGIEDSDRAMNYEDPA